MVRHFLLCALLVGCGFGDDRRLGGSADGGVDSSIDGPPQQGGHLLLTEINSVGAEFVEIWNPTNRAIDLGKYYLADYGDYWKLPSATPAPAQADFLARFPAGAMLQSDQVITVAFIAADFATAYGKAATYALDVTTGAQAFGQRFVNATAAPTITNNDNGAGEIVILFYWDGTSDLVKDVDIVLAGTALTAPGNNLTTKMPVDGPDPDTTATVYKTDNGLLGGGMSSRLAVAGTTFKRRSLETGSETQAGTGNGIGGDDETSEALMATWDGDTPAPHTAATPGVVPTI